MPVVAAFAGTDPALDGIEPVSRVRPRMKMSNLLRRRKDLDLNMFVFPSIVSHKFQLGPEQAVNHLPTTVL